MFGYMDESGSPGVAKYDNEYLILSLVIFDSEKSRDNANAAIEQLRAILHLPNNYEFHCSSNSSRPQAEFFNLIHKLKFRFITIAVKKDNFRRTASYTRIAHYMLNEVQKVTQQIRIEMDSNPTLYAEFRKLLRTKNIEIKIKESRSHSNNLIQVADYVANISARKAKQKTSYLKQYRLISAKKISFMKIN